ncbi:MAG: FAD:protein FMN transferase [Parahaliea sp.]
MAIKLGGPTMGTSWSATYLPGAESEPDNTLAAGLQATLDAVDASMSTYRDDSELRRFNRAEVGIWQPVSAEFLKVLAAALAIGAASEGAYDVSVAPLVNLWGFGPGRGAAKPPAPERIAELRAQVGQQYVEVDTAMQRVRKTRPLSLDFSSIAKGFAVDQMAGYLQAQQIKDFLVEVGGEMRLAGYSPRGDRWRIAIEQPTAGARAPAVALSLREVGLATSGDYRNFFEWEGQRYSHSIDPRSGYPITHDLVSVTVLAASTMEADGWATALEVLGGDDAMRVASARGLAVYFIRRQGDDFVASHTAAFTPYLESESAAQAARQGQAR